MNQRTLFQHNWRPTVWGLLCLIIGGCGENVPEGRIPVYPASGKVTVDGKPASGLLVVLQPAQGSLSEQQGVFPSATTKEDGTFQLTTYEQNDGAPTGEYVVTLRWYQMPSTVKGKPANPFARPTDRFHGKLNNPQTSPWHVTIIEGDNVLKPIAVE